MLRRHRTEGYGIQTGISRSAGILCYCHKQANETKGRQPDDRLDHLQDQGSNHSRICFGRHESTARHLAIRFSEDHAR